MSHPSLMPGFSRYNGARRVEFYPIWSFRCHSFCKMIVCDTTPYPSPSHDRLHHRRPASLRGPQSHRAPTATLPGRSHRPALRRQRATRRATLRLGAGQHYHRSARTATRHPLRREFCRPRSPAGRRLRCGTLCPLRGAVGRQTRSETVSRPLTMRSPFRLTVRGARRIGVLTRWESLARDSETNGRKGDNLAREDGAKRSEVADCR